MTTKLTIFDLHAKNYFGDDATDSPALMDAWGRTMKSLGYDLEDLRGDSARNFDKDSDLVLLAQIDALSQANVELNPYFWDCNCAGDFIHPKTERLYCARCGSHEADCSDSRECDVKDLIRKRHTEHQASLKPQATPVIFRKHKDGEVVAVFPTLLGTTDVETVTTYVHLGQHGHGHLGGIIAGTKPASEEEYAPLLCELVQLGYDDLEVVKRVAPHHRKVRRDSLMGGAN